MRRKFKQASDPQAILIDTCQLATRIGCDEICEKNLLAYTRTIPLLDFKAHFLKDGRYISIQGSCTRDIIGLSVEKEMHDLAKFLSDKLFMSSHVSIKDKIQIAESVKSFAVEREAYYLAGDLKQKIANFKISANRTGHQPPTI